MVTWKLRTTALAAGLALALASLPTTNAGDGFFGYIVDYPSGETDLPSCDDNARGARDELNNRGGWTHTITGDSEWTEAFQAHWMSEDLLGSDTYFSDDADASYICAHGSFGGSGNDGIVAFHNGQEYQQLYSNEARYGNTRVNWVTFDTSKTLRNEYNNPNEWFYYAFDGLHMMMGWHDSPLDTLNGFNFYDVMIKYAWYDGGGHQIKYSWFAGDGGCTGQSSGTTQFIISEHSTYGDEYLPGEGSGPDPDQAQDNTFTWWSNDC